MSRAGERFVTIRHLADPMEAEMLRDLLAQEGITALIPGNTHNAIVGGALSSALQVPLQVRERDAERARAVMDALVNYDSVEPSEDTRAPDASEMTSGAGPYRSAALDKDQVPDRKVVVAIAAALIMPLIIAAFGAGHFYARSYPRGFLLLGLAWSFIVLGVMGYGRMFYALPLIMLIDAAGASLVIQGRRSR